MKLKSLQLFPSGKSGWKSDLLIFGENITQLFGKNGCGKTPIVQSIVFCLGYPSKFRQDIYEHCSYALLEVETPNGNLKLKRIFSKDVDIEVIEPNGNTQRFFNEKDYSLFIFEWLKLKTHNLITNNNKIGEPYLASMLPIYYLDQDEGYTKFYSPPSNFIKDQFSEMMRMIFNLPVKNSFDAEKAKIQAKEDLDYLDKQVETYARNVEVAKKNVSTITTKSSEDITNEIKLLTNEFEELKSSGANIDDAVNSLDHLIANYKNDICNISYEISEISKRSGSINQMIHEINTEIETLNINEEARRVFLSFKEICSSNHCHLFSSSSDSYSKNLLYLRDQIKDLERNSEIDIKKKEQLNLQKQTLEKKVQELVIERNDVFEKSEVSTLVDTLSEIKKRIFNLQNLLNEIIEIETLENRYVHVLGKRNEAIDKYQSFSTNNKSNPNIIKLRVDLRQYFLNWLDVLSTKNISRDVTFKEDFTPVLGTELISQLKGSTRTRAVLAFHAALIELISERNIDSFKFFIMDTPKQHEVHNDDLDCYIKKLKELSQQSHIQIVFSTTEYHYDVDDLDKEWIPKYPGEKQNMFLNRVSNVDQ